MLKHSRSKEADCQRNIYSSIIRVEDEVKQEIEDGGVSLLEKAFVGSAGSAIEICFQLGVELCYDEKSRRSC